MSTLRKDKPHNIHKPLDLRKHPVCYLCGGRWGLSVTRPSKVRTVKCDECDFWTCVEDDSEVFRARGWTR
jgi:hypothetical protein